MARKKLQIVFDEWDMYVSSTEEGPLFISFDVQAAREDLTRTLRQCARIIIPIKKPNDSGGPVEPESSRIYQMEDDLCAALADNGVDCRLVGRLTCAGMRELVFQLEDFDEFRPVVAQWMESNNSYEMDVSEHEGWQFFNDVIRPTDEIWLYLADRSVVNNLLEAGSNPSKPHDIEFVFHAQVAELKKLLKALEQRGYKALGGIDAKAEELVAVKRLQLDLDVIYEESLANQQLAEEHEAVYDGWGAMVVK